ncbi:MAG: S1 RNA-binding domain-containing protein [Nanoarchaeota archaeon]
MFYKKKGYPEEEEIVFCKVSKIFPNSVFVELLEYGEQGLVHISEIAPGRIRNLRDYVVEGKQIVCKVLRIDRAKGHIDLSLRRVNSHQRQGKLDEIKQELTAETLIQNMAKRMQKPVEELYKQVTEKIFTEYSHLYLCFKEVAAGEASLEKLGLEKKLSDNLTAAIIDRFKPSKITVKGEIKIQSYAADGVEKIKTVLLEIEKISPTIRVFYLGGGRFKVTIEDIDYKPAEQTMRKVQEVLEKFNDKSSTAVFEREKTD